MKKEEVDKHILWFKVNDYLESTLAKGALIYFSIFTTVSIFYIISHNFFKVKTIYEIIGVFLFIFSIWIIAKYQFKRGLK